MATDYKVKGIARRALVAAAATITLAGGAFFAINTEGTGQVFRVDQSGNIYASGSTLAMSGATITIPRKYATFVLYGSGSSTATASDVFGNYEAPFGGTIVDAYANVTQAADDAATTIDVKINGTSAFSTNLTIDSGETSSRTAASHVVTDAANNSFSAGDNITFGVTAGATTPAVNLSTTLVIDVTSTP